jgi:hypothetical protein
VLSIVVQRPRIMLLLAIVAAVTLADDPIQVLGPSLAHELGIPNIWPAFFLAALGAGTILGALFPVRPTAARRAVVPLGVLAISVFVFALGVSPYVSLIAAIVAGASGLLTGSAAQALLLKQAPPERALQVMALWAVAWAGTKPIASLTDGLLASQFGIRWAAAALAIPAISIALGEKYLHRTPRTWLKGFMRKYRGRELAATHPSG